MIYSRPFTLFRPVAVEPSDAQQSPPVLLRRLRHQRIEQRGELGRVRHAARAHGVEATRRARGRGDHGTDGAQGGSGAAPVSKISNRQWGEFIFRL